MAVDQDTLNAHYAGLQDALNAQFAAGGPPPAPPRGPVGEIFTGAKRGALVDLPSLAGRALQYASTPGGAVSNFGRGMVASADARGQREDLTLQPESHGTITNALASGAQMLAPALAVPAAVGTGAAAAGASPLLATGAAAVAGGALFGAEAGQNTLEKAQKAGVDDATARTAARINAATTMATQTGLGMVGGQLLGKVGGTLGKIVGTEGPALAESVLGDLTGASGVIKPFLKQLPTSAAEAVGANALQSGVSAAVEQHYGIDNTSPADAAMGTVAPTLGLVALMGPMALVSRAMNVRAAKTRADALAHPDTPAAIRAELADSYTDRLAAVDPAAAVNFSTNAETAINRKLALPVDAKVLSPDAVDIPKPPESPLALQNNPSPMVVFPDGTVGRSNREVEDYISGLPADQQTAARAKLFGMGEQPATPAPETPPLQLENNPSAGRLYAFPDGTITNDVRDVQKYVEGLPADQQTAARAKLFGLGEQPAGGGAADEAFALHAQVREGLRNAGIEPAAPLTREEFAQTEDGKDKTGEQLAKAYRGYLADPETQRDLMRRDAQAFDEMSRQPPPEPIPDAPPDTQGGGQSEPLPGKTAMAQAMEQAFKNRDIDAAYAQREATKARETDAIANVTKGAELAAAAERGEVKPDANAPKAREEIESDWKDAMKANDMDTKQQSLVPFMKRLDAMGFDKFETHQQQIDALEQIVGDKKISQGQRDRADMLLQQWKKDLPADETKPAVVERAGAAPTLEAPAPGGPPIAGEPAAGAARALGENIPPAAPTKPAIPGEQAAASVGVSNLPLAESRMPVTDMAQAAADRVASLRAEFSQRLRSGEKLSALEQERMDDLKNYANTLQPYLEGRAKPRDAEFVKAMAEMVDEASSPYKRSLRNKVDGLRATDSNDASPELQALTSLVHSADGVMGHLAANGSEPWVRELASKLQPLMGKTTIGYGETPESAAERAKDADVVGLVVGEYDNNTDHIGIFKATESTILHEAVHAATEARLTRAEEITRPSNQDEAKLKKAFDDYNAIYNEAKKFAGQSLQYGMQDIHEFTAELHANPAFRDFLRNGGWWGRIVNAVRSLLGMAPKDTGLVERALEGSQDFFSKERLNEQFDASPEGAASTTDHVLQRVVSDADRKAFHIDPTRVSLTALRGFLPLQTLNYIAGRVKALPEFVKSGFAAGVEAHTRANTSHDVVTNHLNDPSANYVSALEKTFRSMDPGKAKALEREMAEIGGEASRIGFDYRKNGRDNLAADKSIDPANKDYIDAVHRRFTQLQKSNPEIAAALEEGERHNRRTLIEKVATVAANMMDDHAGRARHLQAELDRMAPGDAARAELENRVKLANTDALLASAHSRGLDIMDGSLAQGKNPDPVRFSDAATANLGARLQTAFTAARALPDGSPLKKTLGALESLYAKEAQNPYFSLGRDGDFFVKVGFKGVDAAANARIQDALKGSPHVVGDLTRGDSHAFFRVGTADEAEALGKKLAAAGQGSVVDPAWGRLAEKTQEAASVSPALRTLLASVDDMQMNGLGAEQVSAVKQTLTRQLLSMLPETASRSASMARQGVPGYSADFLTQFARRSAGAVHDTAGIYTSRAYTEAARLRKDAIEQLNRTGSADARQRAQLIDDEINKRYANAMKPVGADWVSMANSLSHSFYLGLSPAFFIRTMAQPWHRGLPFMGSKFGFLNSSGELAKAMPVGLKLVANSVAAAVRNDGARGILATPTELSGLNLSPREQAWIEEAHANGKLDLGQSAQLMRMAMGAGDRKVRDAMRMASATAQYAEMSNRIAVGMAALRLAVKNPERLAAGETPETYALKAMENVMDDFSPSNTARGIGRHGFAGKMTPLVSQFQNYNLQSMQQIARTVHDGFFGQDKSPEGLQRASEAKREFAGLMATTAVITGALGLPFANAFAGVYNSLMSDKDDPKDVRVSLRNWANDTFGHEMGTVLTKGLPSLANVDTSTFGLQGILPGSEFLADRTLWKDRSEAEVRNMLGPAVAMGLDLSQAVARMSDGYWLKGIEAALPVGLRSFYKTAEMAGVIGPGGYTDSKGNPIPLKAGASDIAWRALGFQTESKSLQGDAQRDFLINQERLKARGNVIKDEFVKATRTPAAMPDAVADLVAYNAKNPMQPITSHDIQGAVAGYYTRMALGEASGMGIATGKRQMPALLAQERFAAMPGR